ncbi:hypothetical protein AB0F43_04480 [Kribbella sp. NPDC023972]|uniref:hypothetical protein n=1 Tax=Kribbella sp. NPDC023972 TaxID=3154795 RepID=UPI00340F0CD0
MLRRLVTVVAIAALLAGCDDTPDGGGTPSLAPTTASETTGEPSPEPTTQETTQTEVDKPSISIANAPIGGDVEEDGVEQCAEVNWLGKSPIPDGTTISLGPAELSRSGVFEFYQGACPGDVRACTDVKWHSGDFKPCYVGVRQVAHSTESVSLVIPVEATCETEADCQNLAKGFGDSQIDFDPIPLETPTTEPPTEPTETPSDG